MATRATNPLERRVVIPLAIGVGVLAIGTIVYIATRDGEPEKKPAAGGLGSGFPMPMPSRPKPARAAVDEVDEVEAPEEPEEKTEEPKPPRAWTEPEIQARLKEKASADSSLTITRKRKRTGKVLSRKKLGPKKREFETFRYNEAGEPYVLIIYSYDGQGAKTLKGVLSGWDKLYTVTKTHKGGKKARDEARNSIKNKLDELAESNNLGAP